LLIKAWLSLKRLFLCTCSMLLRETRVLCEGGG